MSPLLRGKEPTWTRERLPDGVDVVAYGSSCRTCGAGGIDSEMIRSWRQVTRSEEPDEVGQYLIQPHHRWCPVWTGETAELPCPVCGAPVEGYDFENGYSLEVPDALAPGGVGHLVGSGDEVFGHPAARYVGATPKPAPSFSKMLVEPCGHELRGDVAYGVVTRAAEIRANRRRAEALLQAATQAGHSQLVEAYRRAVRSRSRDASGLLAALRLLHPQHTPEGDPA